MHFSAFSPVDIYRMLDLQQNITLAMESILTHARHKRGRHAAKRLLA